ncbi:hypothetical protein [Streptomyces yangpuensis]|uniref:hypothetical protein n=1 Tax=Streptomyces yangpuensis TaxID=1648182 RepID=UPI003802561C
MTKSYVAGVVALVGCKVAEITGGDSVDTVAGSVEVIVIGTAVLHLACRAIDYGKRVNRAVQAAERTPRVHATTTDIHQP